MCGWPISRILSQGLPPLDDHSSSHALTDAVQLPTRASRAEASLRRYPMALRPLDQPRARPLFGIAPGGACRASPVTSPAVGSYPTVSPFPLRTGVVSSLWRFPWGYPRRGLPGTLALWSPDFPREAYAPRGHPAIRTRRGLSRNGVMRQYAKRRARSAARLTSCASSGPVAQGRKRKRKADSRAASSACG